MTPQGSGPPEPGTIEKIRGDRPLRVLFLASYFPKPANTVMGVWALEQAQALLARGIELTVVSFTSWVPRILAGVVRAGPWASCPPVHRWGDLIVHYPRWLLYQKGCLKRQADADPRFQQHLAWLSARRWMLCFAESYRPDLLFVHNTLTNGHLALRLHQTREIPFVITDHDYDEIIDCARYPQRRQFFLRIMKHASMMVEVSTQMKHAMEHVFPEVPTRVVLNGTNLPNGRLAAQPRPAELIDREIVLGVGAFMPRKEFPLLVRAFGAVANRYPRALLRIVGDGEDRPAIEHTIRELGLRDRVQLLGRQTHERVLQEMAWSDVFALLSSREPFGVVFAEAMASGKPILCTRECGVTDVAQDSVHGRIVAPRDVDAAATALDQLLSDRDVRFRMGEEARRTAAASLTWHANAQAMLEVFRAALGARIDRGVGTARGESDRSAL